MNRRGFLKKCGLIPFVGGLANTGLSEAKQESFEGLLAPYEQPFLDEQQRIFNGQIFEAPYPLYHTVIAQWFDLDKWILLSEPYLAAHAARAMMVCRFKRKDGSYNPFYTQRELQEKLKDWKLLENATIRMIRRITRG